MRAFPHPAAPGWAAPVIHMHLFGGLQIAGPPIHHRRLIAPALQSHGTPAPHVLLRGIVLV